MLSIHNIHNIPFLYARGPCECLPSNCCCKWQRTNVLAAIALSRTSERRSCDILKGQFISTASWLPPEVFRSTVSFIEVTWTKIDGDFCCILWVPELLLLIGNRHLHLAKGNYYRTILKTEQKFEKYTPQYFCIRTAVIRVQVRAEHDWYRVQ